MELDAHRKVERHLGMRIKGKQTQNDQLNQQMKVPVSDRIKGILSTAQKTEMTKVTFEKFQRNMDRILGYSEIHSTMGFYPIVKNNCPKVVFLPGAPANIVWKMFSHGFVDCIYSTTGEELEDFPEKFKRTIVSYLKHYTKGNEIFMKVFSSYPVFNDQQIAVPSLSFIRVGVANGVYPLREEITRDILHQKMEIAALMSVWNATKKIDSSSRVRTMYTSQTVYIFCNDQKNITEEGMKALANFENPFRSFEGIFTNLPAEVRENLCNELSHEDEHACSYCCDKISKASFGEEDYFNLEAENDG